MSVPHSPSLSRASSLDAGTDAARFQEAVINHAPGDGSESSEALHLGRSEDETESHETFWDKLCAMQHELSEVERKINRHSSLKEARQAGCTRNRHCWVILHQGRPTSVAKRFRALLPPELASAIGKDSPVRASVVTGFEERFAESEVSPSEPRRPRAKPRAREPLPVAMAPTFCLSDTHERKAPVARQRKSLAAGASRSRLRSSLAAEPEQPAVSEISEVQVEQPPPSEPLSVPVDCGSFKDKDSVDDLRGIVSLDVDLDTPASATFDQPSKAESSPINKEEDMLLELQQLAASVKLAPSESSSESEPRLVVAQDPRGHGSMPGPYRSSAGPVTDILPRGPNVRARTGSEEHEDVLALLQQLEHEDSEEHDVGRVSSAEDGDEDSLEAAEEDEEDEDEEEDEEESESEGPDPASETK